MKLSRKLQAAAAGRSSLRCIAQTLSCVALFSLLGAPQSVRAQGDYYPVFPVGAPYGSTYTGTPVLLVNELNFVDATLKGIYGPSLTLQIPFNTGDASPDSVQLKAAVLQVAQYVLANTAPPGITLQSLSREIVAYRPADRVFTVDAIAGAIVADGSLSVAGKVARLNDVTVALAQAQPTLIDSLIQPILAQARTDASVAQQAIPLVTVSAITAIPRDSVRVAAIIGTAIGNIGQATVLSNAQKNALYTDPSTGLIKAVLSSSVVDNNPALIDAAVKKFTETNSLNYATLDQVLTSAVAGLLTKNNSTVSALAAGALRSQAGSALQIQTRLNSELVSTPLLAAQTNEFVDGYLQGGSLVNLTAELTGNVRADAVAGGAVIRAVLSTAVIVKESLISEAATGGSLTTAKDVVMAVVAANLDQAVNTVVGAIQKAGDPAPYTPWGDGTLADVAGGAIAAARIEAVGTITQNVIQKSAASVSALNVATVNSIVNASIVDASATGKSGAFADIVYKAEFVARSTVGASGPLVRQAIQSIDSVTAGPSIERPHYIAVVAALAGATNTQRNEIRDAAFLNPTGEMYLVGGDVLAATYGANLVRDVLGNTARAYTTTLTAFNSAALGLNPGAVPTGTVDASVLAGLYAAVLVNTNESSAGLAAAIKQSDVSATTLTNAAIDAVRGVNATKEPSLKLVGIIADYAKTSALDGTSDPLDYIGRQVIANPTLVKDIATAWTVVDPNHAHYVSHAVAFNSPASITTSISSIFTYAQITNPTPFVQPTLGNPTGAIGVKAYLSGNQGVIIDQTAAAAAITAGLVTGILEAKLDAAERKSRLVSAVSAAVLAAVAQDNTYLRGPTNPFNYAGDSSADTFADLGGAPNSSTVGLNSPAPSPAASNAIDSTEGFRQSNGLGGLKTGLGARTVGAAGAITAYIAQTTQAGDTSIVKYGDGETASTSGSVAFAVLQAATSGQARQYGLEIAQAAAQALRWVAGSSINVAQAAADIANAIAPSVVGVHDFGGLTLAQTFAKLQTAALFGISEAANGTIGAGALGLNATGLDAGSITVKAAGNNNADFYMHRSATGTPVTDIFNL